MSNSAEAPLVLIADDDAVTRRLLKHHLEEAGYQVIEAADGADAIGQLNDDVAVALVDLQMPKASGLDCLAHARTHCADTQVLVISGKGEIRDAVAAMKQGACEYVTKPFDAEELLAHVQQAVRTAQLARENRALRDSVGSPLPDVQFVAKSAAGTGLLKQIEKIARLDSNVLITGPSGTGKTTIARMIHQASARRERPFVAVSCAALPRDLIEAELFGHERGAFTGAVRARVGRAEAADGGTLFLDEVGDLPLELQPKLLTFLQDHTLQRLGGNRQHRVDVRVIAATLQDLEEMGRQRLFRQDLYFRLNVLPLKIPPLAERGDDIPQLATQLLDRIARQRGRSPWTVSNEAMARLVSHRWPGNIRELENVLERTTAFCENSTIEASDLPIEPGADVEDGAQVGSLAGMSLADVERQAISQTLEACGGNRASAARILGISERSVYNKIKRMGL